MTKAVHLDELRTALREAYVAAGPPPPSFVDPSIVPQGTVMKAAHVRELRDAVIDLELY